MIPALYAAGALLMGAGVMRPVPQVILWGPGLALTVAAIYMHARDWSA